MQQLLVNIILFPLYMGLKHKNIQQDIQQFI